MLVLGELQCWINQTGGPSSSAFASDNGHMPKGSSQTREDKYYTSPANQEHLILQIYCLWAWKLFKYTLELRSAFCNFVLFNDPFACNSEIISFASELTFSRVIYLFF